MRAVNALPQVLDLTMKAATTSHWLPISVSDSVQPESAVHGPSRDVPEDVDRLLGDVANRMLDIYNHIVDVNAVKTGHTTHEERDYYTLHFEVLVTYIPRSPEHPLQGVKSIASDLVESLEQCYDDEKHHTVDGWDGNPLRQHITLCDPDARDEYRYSMS